MKVKLSLVNKFTKNYGAQNQLMDIINPDFYDRKPQLHITAVNSSAF
jgi:hypothetical protein